MRILALDSSGLVASVAIVAGADGKADAQTIGEYTMNYKKTHSQTLLPMLDELVKMTEVDLKTIDAIAVAAGPGSFTGLRIGSATAKGLGLALEKPIMDARRGQVYTGIYRFDTVGELRIVEDQMAVSIEELAEKLRGYGEKVTFLGDGVPVFKEQITEELLADRSVSFAPAHLNRQRAASVGALALTYYADGRVETAAEHQPDYLRVSQAERERKERLEKKWTSEY